MPAILRISASHTSGAPNIIALVFACSFEGPPSTRYEATVGTPANPISGVAPTAAGDGGHHEAHVLGVGFGDRRDVVERPHGLGDHRPDARLDVEVDCRPP